MASATRSEGVIARWRSIASVSFQVSPRCEGRSFGGSLTCEAWHGDGTSIALRTSEVRVESIRAALEARRDAELRHGTRSFVDERELEARRDVLLERIADRATERVLQRDRQIGREL
jgi:hypothetical protein